MQYVYALNPVCIVLIIPGHSRREVLASQCIAVNWEYNDDRRTITLTNTHEI